VKGLRQPALLRVCRQQVLTRQRRQQGGGIVEVPSVARRTPGFTSWTKIDSTNHAAIATIRK
jgi:ATP-dependent Zn protease